MRDSRNESLSIINTFFASIPDEKYSKVISSIFLFDFLDLLLKENFPKDWVENFRQSSLACSNSLQFLSENLDRDLPISSQGLTSYSEVSKDVAHQTGEVYYELWVK